MRDNLMCSFVLATASGCASVALGQYTIPANVIVTPEGPASNYNGPSNYGYVGALGSVDGYLIDWMQWQGGLPYLTLHRRVDTLTDINVYRHIDTFTNNTNSVWSFGAWASGRNTAVGYFVPGNEPYYVTHDPFGPAMAFMHGNNAWAADNMYRQFAGGPTTIQEIYAGFTLAPGESITLMFATHISFDQATPYSDQALALSRAQAIVADPWGSGLYAGLSQSEINSIVNWVPSPGAATALSVGGLALLRRRRR